jgi:hypothetical protein
MRHCHRANRIDQLLNVHTSPDLRASLGLLQVNRRSTMGMINKATTRVHGALDQVVEAAAPAAQWLEEHGEELTAKGEKLVERSRKYIVANPLQSFGLALAAGYLVSRLTR